MDKFTKDVIKKLEGLNDKILGSNKKWTDAVKKALIDIADENGLSEHCNLSVEKYKKHKNLEWLYDIIIFSWREDIFSEVYLVGESEWDLKYEAIEYDFLKLLFVRSKIHLMVYQVFEQNYDEYKNSLINIIEKSKSCLKGDVYLFAIFNKTTEEFKIEQYIKKGN
jgi:hypothetical protein